MFCVRRFRRGDVTSRPPLTTATQQSDELQPSSQQQREACVVFSACITELRVRVCVCAAALKEMFFVVKCRGAAARHRCVCQPGDNVTSAVQQRAPFTARGFLFTPSTMEWTPCGRRRYDRIVRFTPSLCVTLCVRPAAPKGSVAVKFTSVFDLRQLSRP